MSDLIDRQAAIDAVNTALFPKINTAKDAEKALRNLPSAQPLSAWGGNPLQIDLPSAQPEYHTDEWCTDCKEYDHERHCCPRWNRVIRTILQEARLTGRWIWDDEGFHCSECWHHTYGNTGEVLSGDYKFCPNCGLPMKKEVGE